jgi:lauroyl/myristoyl acyltransferase
VHTLFPVDPGWHPVVAFVRERKPLVGKESLLQMMKYGVFCPVAALFPLPVAYRLARLWARLEARRNPGLVEAVRTNAELVLGPSAPPLTTGNLGEQFYEVMNYDQIDAYAPLVHPWRRLSRWVQLSGEERLLPCIAERRGILLLTFHVGGGSLVFSYLRSRGRSAHYLSIAPQQFRKLSGRVQYAFGWFRLWGVERASGQKVIFVGGSKEKIRQVLRQRGIVVALLDVVPDSLDLKERAVACFFGRLAHFPTGLLSVAAETEADIVPFFGRVGEDWYRHLSFEVPHRVEHIEETLSALVGLLEAYIRRYPQEWHFWPGLQHFYT